MSPRSSLSFRGRARLLAIFLLVVSPGALAQPFDNGPAARPTFDNASPPAAERLLAVAEDPRYRKTHEPDRLALVIGNSAYKAPVETVDNAVLDAQLIGARLRELDFKVEVVPNADYERLVKEIQRMRDERIPAASSRGIPPLVVIYFGGHGFNSDGEGFITGVDITADTPIRRSLSLRTVREWLYRNSTLVMLLDTCRTRPPKPEDAKAFDNSDKTVPANVIDPAKEEPAIRSVLRLGIRGQKPTVDPERKNEMRVVLYSFAVLDPGRAAQSYWSGSTEHSAYTESLSNLIGKADDLNFDLRHVESDVFDKTKKAQQPTREGDVGQVYPNKTEETRKLMEQKWLKVLVKPTIVEINNYILDYPESPYRAAASDLLLVLERGEGTPR